MFDNFINLINEFGMFQMVKSPTLGNNILDLVLCQHKDLIFNLQNNQPFSTSDHDSLTFQLFYSQGKLQNDEKKLDFNKGYYDLI